jgi:hypothetical protein
MAVAAVTVKMSRQRGRNEAGFVNGIAALRGSSKAAAYVL